MRASLADDLRDFIDDIPANEPLFRMPHKNHVAEMFRDDLAAGRLAWIEEAKSPGERRKRTDSRFLVYRDDSGRVLDSHALRHTFGTNLARGGVHPKVAQALARHSTITLTMDRYSHTVIGDQASALGVLPPSTPPAATVTPDSTRVAAG